MTTCPLCVSGLPPEGESIEGRRRNEGEGDEESCAEDSCYEEDISDATERTRSPPRTQVVMTKTGSPPRQCQPSLPLHQVNSYDSGATTQDDESSVSSRNTNMYEEFQNFLAADQIKMRSSPVASHVRNGHLNASPKTNQVHRQSPKISPRPSSPDPTTSPIPNMRSLMSQNSPRPNSPQSYFGQSRGRGDASLPKQRLPPPPHNVRMKQQHSALQNNQWQQHLVNAHTSPVKRPDPESNMGPQSFHHPQSTMGRAHPNNNRQQQHYKQHQYHSMSPDHGSLNTVTRQYKTPPPKMHPSQSLPYPIPSTPKEHMEPDQLSINSASRYQTPRADPEEASVHSMNSVKRNLYNKSPYNTPRDHDDLLASNNVYTPKPLEQDEVSAVSMNSVTRNLYNKSSESLDIDNENNEEASASSNSNECTARYDAKGKCIRHPTVRLRKKKLFGGWQILLSNCPECCLDEMRRVKDERSRSSKSKSGSRCGSESGSLGGKSKSSKLKKKREKQRHKKEPPMSQIHLGSNVEDDKSIGTASTITISSYTASSGKGRMNWLDFTSNDEAGPACVTRMPYVDHRGEKGWYTGSVDGTTGLPHGFGTMNFSNGATFEGHWRNGRAFEESEINSPAKARYPPQGHTVRRQQHIHHPPPRSPLETHYEDDSRSSSRQRSRPLSQQQQMSPMKLPQHLSSQHHREVVCGMIWTDSTGTGAYTGEVNGLNIPDGVGSMRYNTGIVAEGLWIEGEIEEDANEDADDSLSYQGGNSHGHSDGFLGRNNAGQRLNSGSASVM